MATGGITFDGSSQYLELGAKIVSSYPMSLVIWLAAPLDGSGSAAAICQGSTTADAFQWGGFENSSNNKYTSDRSASGGSFTATRTTTPNISNAAYGLLVCVFEATQQTVYYNSNSGTTNTASPSQVFSDLNRFLIGAWRRSAGLASFAKMTACEAHVFNTALTSGNVTTLLTTTPESVSGWVDGWTLASNSALTSLGGTRTLTATGSPTTASLPLPYTRASNPILTSPTGTATGATTGSGTVSTTGTDGLLWRKASASASTDPGAGNEAAAGWTSQAVSASGTQNVTFTGLTTNTAVVPNYLHVSAGGLRSTVATGAAFTPATLAIAGTALSAQSVVQGAALTWAGATPESLITNTGVGTPGTPWSILSGAGASGATINPTSGILVVTSGGTVGGYTITLQRVDASTPTAQTVTKTVSLTVTASGGGGTPPSISTHPASQSVTEGAAASFSVVASGSGTLAYQWRRNGTNIGGATSSTYSFTTVLGDNGAVYSVVVTGDTSPPATSNNATLTVTAASGTYSAQTDIIAESGIALASTLVYYTWCPAGRPGSIASPVNGTATTDSAGRATIIHTVAGDGFAIIGRRPGPLVSNDRVFAQFLTLA